MKKWAKELFNAEVAQNFEKEDIDGTTLQSMNCLGLTTIGKKDKFVVAVRNLLVNPDLSMFFIHSLFLFKV